LGGKGDQWGLDAAGGVGGFGNKERKNQSEKTSGGRREKKKLTSGDGFGMEESSKTKGGWKGTS